MKWAESIAEEVWFVLPSYIFALGLSSLAISHDFVSKRWMSVKETRKRGMYHSIAIFISLIIMTFYVIVQSMKGDFKEMSTGFIALCFALLHLYRTFVGLWQLYCFREWVSSSLKSVDSIRVNEVSSNKAENHFEDYFRLQADDVMVNDSVIENKILEGEVRCSINFYRKHYLDILIAVFKNFIPLLFLVIFDVGKKSDFVSNSKVPYITLKQPHDVWIRWATVFIANFHGKGRELVHEDANSDTRQISNSDLDRFRQEIILYCSLHVEDDFEGNISFPREYWSKLSSFDKLSEGFFDKSEFLKIAQETGQGLPFGQAHEEADYTAYRTKLDKFKSELHVDVIKKVDDLQIEDIEWLLVIISIGNWGFNKKKHKNNVKSIISKFWMHSIRNRFYATILKCKKYITTVFKRSKELELDSQKTTPIIDKAKGKIYEEIRIHPAVHNLIEQVGMNGDFNALFPNSRVPKFFKSISFCQTYQKNKNLLQICYHLDNWIAIYTGVYVRDFMLKHRENSDGKFHEDFIKQFSIEGSTNEEYYRIFYSNYVLEQSVKTYLLVRSASKSKSASLCFLGCGVEVLRSILADKREEIFDWNPDLENAMNKELKIRISRDLKHLLVDALTGNLSFTFKMKLLWEIQSNVLSNMSEIRRIDADFVFKSVILCLIYFPSIDFRMSISNNCTAKKRKMFTSIEFECTRLDIIPLLAPQDLYVSISFKNEENISLSLRSAGRNLPTRFCWEAWRNAFYGRFHGSEVWQNKFKSDSECRISKTFFYHKESIFKTKLSKVSSQLSHILSGEKFIELWPGWMPYRPNMCMFELELFLSKKEKNSRFVLNLDDSELQNLDMACLLDAISCYEGNNASEVEGYSISKSLSILRTRADVLIAQDKIRSAALLLFLSAISFCDIDSLERSINLLQKHASSDWTEIEKLVSKFQAVQDENFFRNHPKCLRLIGVLRKVMISTKYNLVSTRLFCNAALKYQPDNVHKQKSLEKESFDSLVISLRFHFDFNIDSEFKIASSAMKILQESLINSKSSQHNKLLAAVLQDEVVSTM